MLGAGIGGTSGGRREGRSMVLSQISRSWQGTLVQSHDQRQRASTSVSRETTHSTTNMSIVKVARFILPTLFTSVSADMLAQSYPICEMNRGGQGVYAGALSRVAVGGGGGSQATASLQHYRVTASASSLKVSVVPGPLWRR